MVRVCRSMPGLFNRGHLSRSMGDHRFFLASGDGSRSMEQRRHGNDFAQDVTRSWLLYRDLATGVRSTEFHRSLILAKISRNDKTLANVLCVLVPLDRADLELKILLPRAWIIILRGGRAVGPGVSA